MSSVARTVSALGALLGVAAAQGGGVAVTELGVPGNATALAGWPAAALDASTVYLNPAGMTRLSRTHFQSGISAMYSTIEFSPGPGTTNLGGGGGNAGGLLFGGPVFLSHSLSEDARLGVSLTVPYAVALDYGDDWVGRTFARETGLAVLDLQPAFATRLGDSGWSVGLGVHLQYAALRQKVAVDRSAMSLPDAELELDQDGFDAGLSLGALWEVTERTRFGIHYRSPVSHDLSGSRPAAAGLTAATNSDLKLPQLVGFGGYHALSDRWSVLADVGWSEWSAFDKAPLHVEINPAVVGAIPRRLADTWRVGVGLHYRPVERWLLQAGFAFDSAAANDRQRTPDLPLDRQWRFSAGAEWTVNPSARMGLNYTFADLGSNALNVQFSPSTGRVVGDYDRFQSHAVAFWFDWSF